MSVIKISQKNPLFFCEICQYTTNNKKDYNKHLLTAKHAFRINGNHLVMKPLCCEFCSKLYKSAHGLWYHKRKCEKSQKSPRKSPDAECYKNMTKDELIMHLLKQNNDLMNKVMEIASVPTNATITNNNHFNLNVFLNENCKNAMNMKDFVDSLKIESADLENVGKLGYVEGISNIFIKGLKELNETDRPMHCMDKKRETLYIKDGNVWNKDEKKEKVRQVIGQIAHKNFLKMNDWKEENPAWENTETKKHQQYIEIVKQVFTCITPDDHNGINKIIKKVANEVFIDKGSLNFL